MRDDRRNPELSEFQRTGDGFALVNLHSEAELDEPCSTAAPADPRDFLRRVESLTRGDKHMRVVVYCAGPSCRVSTRAANRLTEAGYTNVLEYRDGVEIWHSSPRGFRGKPGNSVASGDHRAEGRAKEAPRGRRRKRWTTEVPREAPRR